MRLLLYVFVWWVMIVLWLSSHFVALWVGRRFLADFSGQPGGLAVWLYICSYVLAAVLGWFFWDDGHRPSWQSWSPHDG